MTNLNFLRITGLLVAVSVLLFIVYRISFYLTFGQPLEFGNLPSSAHVFWRYFKTGVIWGIGIGMVAFVGFWFILSRILMTLYKDRKWEILSIMVFIFLFLYILTSNEGLLWIMW